MIEIIAKTDGGFVLKVDENDLVMLQGFRYMNGESSQRAKIKIGQKFNIAAMWDYWTTVLSLKADILREKAKIEELAAALEPPVFVVPQIRHKDG